MPYDPRKKPGSDAALRICMLSYRSNPHCGGQGVYVRNLARALSDLGHRVDVVSGPPTPDIDDDITLHYLPGLDLYNPEQLFRTPSAAELADPINLIEWLGVSTMGFPEPLTFGMRAHRFIRRHAAHYDVVHDNQSLSYGVQAIGSLLPTVATIHHPITVDRDIAVRSVRSLWKKAKHLRWYSFISMQKRVARRLSRIITVSRCAGKDIGNAFHIPEHRLRVVPNGIDTKLFRPLTHIDREANRIIVTNSADIPLKGLYYLLHAVYDLSRSREVRLVVVGTPKKNGGILRLISQLGISSRVTFTGRLDNEAFVREYARASVAVVPSVYEGFGLPAGEAMACAVPVISTTGGALPEVVGDSGILVAPESPETLSRAIADLLDHPRQAAQLGAAGFHRVHANFTWRQAAEKTVAVYREAIDDHR